MDLNLNNLKSILWRPTRDCRYKMGPFESILIQTATIRIRGERMINPMREKIMSNNRIMIL